jgi:tripeptide aminopeptidase
MKDRLDRLNEVLKVQSASYEQWRMFAFIIRKIKESNYDFYVDDGNIYIEKGDSFAKPCIVAHMDTVHPIAEDLSILNVSGKLTGFNKVTMTQTGIGGDDKVGIFIALECLNLFDNIKVAFFRDEEVGCVGSYVADMAFFDNCTFVLQCDRRGNRDFITTASGTELSSKVFQKTIKKTIKKFGYSFTSGMMTDVMALKENGLRVSCANISCGYYNPHSDNEYVVVKDVMNCLDMVMDLIYSYGDEIFPHEYVRTYPKYNYNTIKWESKWDKSPWKSEWDTKPLIENTYTPKNKMVSECPSCSMVTELIYDTYFDSHLCSECISIFAR